MRLITQSKVGMKKIFTAACFLGSPAPQAEKVAGRTREELQTFANDESELIAAIWRHDAAAEGDPLHGWCGSVLLVVFG